MSAKEENRTRLASHKQMGNYMEGGSQTLLLSGDQPQRERAGSAGEVSATEKGMRLWRMNQSFRDLGREGFLPPH